MKSITTIKWKNTGANPNIQSIGTVAHRFLP